MNTNDAQNSLKKVSLESASLSPSAIVSLFEIDITDLLKNNERNLYIEGQGKNAYQDNGKHILRFHNNIKLFRSSVFFDGKEYYAAPIDVDGYEISAKGTAPKPKLSIAISPEGLPQETANRITYLKLAMRDLDDLVGAKVTRVRTFAKYLDSSNFYDANGALISNILTPPADFDPDPNAQFPPDIYFVDRKSSESKGQLELELASPFDTQGLKLPGRVVNDSSCPWTYRGEGCCYEWTQQKDAPDSVYLKPNELNHENSNSDCKDTLHGTNSAAPPVATYNNETITSIIGVDVQYNIDNGQDEWNSNTSYGKGVSVRVKVKGVNYYFVSKIAGNKGNPPPQDAYWVADQCSKTIDGCRLRWKNNPEIGSANAASASGPLPFGGFPTSRRAVK